MTKMRVVSRGLIFAMLPLAQCALAGDVVGERSAGTWSRGNFAQASFKCMQAWICSAPDVLHSPDTVVVTTASASVWGTCNAADGPTDSCNACSSNPPQTPCEFWLEKK